MTKDTGKVALFATIPGLGKITGIKTLDEITSGGVSASASSTEPAVVTKPIK